MRSLAFVLATFSLSAACGKAPEAESKAPAAPASSPAPAAQDPTVIKVVSSLPRTGSANPQTTTIVNGIKMAFEDVGWKVGSWTIKYEDWDDASAKKGDWDPEVEAANAEKAVKDPDVMIYIGTFNSGAAKISMPVLNKASLVMISPANTYPGLTKPGKGEPNEPKVYRPTGVVNYFRVVPADDIQGVVAADWAKKLGAKRVYILDDRGLYGKGIADVFDARCADIDVEVLGHEGIDPKAQEYKSLMTKIKGKSPDLVYFGGTTQTNGGQLAKDMIAVGLSCKLMVPDGCCEKSFITSAGADNVNGRTYVTFGGVPPKQQTGKGKEFVAAYQKKYSAEPEAYAIYGYECGQVAVDAIRRAGKKDRAAIMKAVAETKDFNGALGTWSFDANGDTTLKTMSGSMVKDGDFDFVEILGGGS
ncbi:MAG TPA: branched-chain amino acid ABC transporter substrate-binding protein [Planctomycetota bacterium]|nr:branched-chain amino acid ABC transporter substrate-binding protein [Planctomycetota bacterium]